MSLELGGRADKSGNVYENSILAQQLIGLLLEQAANIEVEPLGDEGDKVEFVVTGKDGARAYYQCKASNGTNDYWRPSDLNGYSVFESAKKHILRRESNTYHFVSPLSYRELDSLCERARTSPDVSAFSKHQLTNSPLRNGWDKCQKYFGEDEKTTFYLLQRCYFEQIPDNRIFADGMKFLLSSLFVTDSGEMAEGLLTALKNSVNEEKLWGHPITASEAVRLMESRGYRLRMREHDARVLPRIEEINRLYEGGFRAIRESLFSREETDVLLDHIRSGKSTLLLGKAGVGKSGCIQEVIRVLKKERIPYLALPLDKYRPERFSDDYGQSLGLPGSPVFCMERLFGETPSVLILDQLDSLRWMNGATASALDVCKLMIHEADMLNRYQRGCITLLFACRKFDYETDPGIRELFEKQGDDQSDWERVEVGVLSDEKVRSLVGDVYDSLSGKLRELLRTPSNLYVWTRLENREKNQISTLRQLLENWWKEVIQNCRNKGVSEKDVNSCRDELVSAMQGAEQLVLPIEAISDFDREVDLLTSFGVLFKAGNCVSFVHQSFFDYFSVRSQIVQIYREGKRLPEFYPEADGQTPDKRYQLLMLLQYLLEADRRTFLRECRRMLESNHIHCYFQCCVFDVIGQMDEPDDAVWVLIEKYLSDEKWLAYVLRTVFFGHPAFIQMLDKRIPDYAWWDEEGRILLRSVMEREPELAIEIIERCGAERFPQRELFDLLGADEDCRSPRGFALKLALINKDTALLGYDLSLYRMIERGRPEALELLRAVVEADAAARKMVYLSDDKAQRKYAEQNAERIIETLAARVTEKAAQESKNGYGWDNRWCGQHTEEGAERSIFMMVQAALSWLAENKPADFLEYLKSNASKTEFDAELNIHAVQNLPLTYSDDAIEWLISDFDRNAFESTSGEENMLSACQRVIERFSSHCSDECFSRLERLICAWKPPIEEMRRVLEYRKKERDDKDYWAFEAAFWGHLQFMLLPCLDRSRMRAYSLELIEVLKRKFPYGVREYDMDRDEAAKFMSSPIAGHSQAFCDDNWLRLIDDVSARGEKWSHGSWSNGTISSPEMFAKSFSDAAEKEPFRFAKLSLSFPERAYAGFKEGAVNACKSAEVPLDLACKVIRKFCKYPSRNMAVVLSRTVEERASEEWPSDIIEMLSDIAVNHPNPEKGAMPVRFANEERENICESLWQSSFNCARGCALNAIALLIFEHSGEGKRYESVIRISVADPHPAVRFASMKCVYAYYNIDKDIAKAFFDTLLQCDPRILYLQETEELMLRFYAQDRKRYRTALVEAFRSQLTEVRKKAVEIMTLLTAQDDWMLEELLSLPLTKEDAEAASVGAVCLIRREEYRSLGKRIALHMLVSGAGGREIAQLLADKALDLEKDKELIGQLLCSEDRFVSNRALNYLCETDGPIAEYIGTVLKYVKEKLAAGVYYLKMERLIKCIARAFQQGMEDAAIRRLCLEAWDEMFMRFPPEMKGFSEKLV